LAVCKQQDNDQAAPLSAAEYKEYAVRIALGFCSFLLIIALALPALAAQDAPIASKDNMTFNLEDLHLYFLRNLGNDGLIDFFQMMVVYEEGIKQGLKPNQAEADDFITKQIGQDTYNQFKQLYSERAVRQLVEYTLVSDKYSTWLRDKILREKNITVSADEAKKYFFDNITQFHLPEGVRISIISVDTKPAADDVIKRLQKGENFNDIASQANIDPRMRAARGEYGVYRKGDGLPEVMEKAALALQKDQYSAVIKGDVNYHVVFCHERVPEVSPTFEDVKEDLMKDMIEAKIDPFYSQALDDLMRREMPRFKIIAELFKPADAGTAPAASPAKPAANPKPAGDSAKPGSGNQPRVE
jgi:foldase protein PrsA